MRLLSLGEKKNGGGKKNKSHGGFFANLGPGLITGAADDDPSGISTYSVAGAAFGYMPLWTVFLTFPLMAAVQLMCARLGLVTGLGLAAAIRRRYPPWVLWGACLLLIIANLVNISADLGGMAEASELVTGVPSFAWLPIHAGVLIVMLCWSSYRTIARVFKWLTLVLFAYVLGAFFAHADWTAALAATLIPRIEWSRSFLAALVAIFGTTISPYLFFWQAAEEVEEERSLGRNLAKRRGATDAELRAARTDVMTGMFFANLIMYFIIVTTAATLHRSGHTTIGTAREAAEALRPLAGNGAYLLFTLGLIGTGMLGVPVLVGSCAYALAEALGWRASLNERPRRARRFYEVVALAMIGGLALDYAGLNAIKMLFWSAVVNGVLAPPLLLLIVLLTSDPTVMGHRTNSRLLRSLGWVTLLVMTTGAIGLMVT